MNPGTRASVGFAATEKVLKAFKILKGKKPTTKAPNFGDN